MQETTLRLQTGTVYTSHSWELSNTSLRYTISLAPTLGISQSLALMQPSRPLEPVKGKILKPVRHAQGREDGKRLRPIHRKGFPIRSTMRAMVATLPVCWNVDANVIFDNWTLIPLFVITLINVLYLQTTYAPERFDINARDMTPSSHVDLSNLSSIH
jgi:hypothetical protein